MFNIGIIGCGKIAQVRHIPEYAAHPAARLTGYYDLNQERAQALAAQIFCRHEQVVGIFLCHTFYTPQKLMHIYRINSVIPKEFYR